MIDYLLDFIPFANKIDLIDSSETENNTPKKGTLDNFINSKVDNSKIELFNEYIKKFSPDGISKIPILKELNTKCMNCNKDDFVIDYRQSYEICNSCGKIEYLLDLPYTNNKNNVYSEDHSHPQINYFEYKRKCQR